MTAITNCGLYDLIRGVNMTLPELINHCKEVARTNYNACGKHFNIDETRFIICFVDGCGDYRKINCPDNVFIKIFNRYKSNRENINFSVELQFDGRVMTRIYHGLPYIECSLVHYRFDITQYLPFIKYLTK